MDYDVAYTVADDEVSGTISFTSLGDLTDFEGYGVGESLPFAGTITDDVIDLTVTDALDPIFAWRQLWGGDDLAVRDPVPAPGSLSELGVSYGVTFRTATLFGGENDCNMALVP